MLRRRPRCAARREFAANPVAATNSTTAATTSARRRINFIIFFSSRSGLTSTLSCRGCLGYPSRDVQLDHLDPSPPEPARSHSPLQQAEREASCKSEYRYGNRCGDHSLQEITRLIDDDVAETAATDDSAEG